MYCSGLWQYYEVRVVVAIIIGTKIALCDYLVVTSYVSFRMVILFWFCKNTLDLESLVYEMQCTIELLQWRDSYTPLWGIEQREREGYLNTKQSARYVYTTPGIKRNVIKSTYVQKTNVKKLKVITNTHKRLVEIFSGTILAENLQTFNYNKPCTYVYSIRTNLSV